MIPPVQPNTTGLPSFQIRISPSTLSIPISHTPMSSFSSPIRCRHITRPRIIPISLLTRLLSVRFLFFVLRIYSIHKVCKVLCYEVWEFLSSVWLAIWHIVRFTCFCSYIFNFRVCFLFILYDFMFWICWTCVQFKKSNHIKRYTRKVSLPHRYPPNHSHLPTIVNHFY